jgi:hypothetical protein
LIFGESGLRNKIKYVKLAKEQQAGFDIRAQISRPLQIIPFHVAFVLLATPCDAHLVLTTPLYHRQVTTYV